MKSVFLLSPVILLSLGVNAQKKTVKKSISTTKSVTATASTGTLKNDVDSISYAFGISLGQYMKSQNIKNVNYKMLNSAIESTLTDKPCLIDANVANQIMGKMAQEKTMKMASGEKVKSQKFLDENKKRAGVMTTASGLQYEIITKGTGAIPKRSDTVVAHYAGSLYSGKEFDNSYKRGEPLTIPVAGVIPGWTEALQMMPVGSKWKLYIPSNLGYGDNGAGQDIPGGAALVFEVELLGIGKAEAATPKQ